MEGAPQRRVPAELLKEAAVDDLSFGARFLDEWRRLTQTSAGFDYQRIEQIRQMDRAAFMAALGQALLAGRADVDPAAVAPEQLAQIAASRASTGAGVDILAILGGFA
jgi:hypothetical protein